MKRSYTQRKSEEFYNIKTKKNKKDIFTDDYYSFLSFEQKKIIDSIVRNNENAFITGPPGVGKSVIVKFLEQYLKNNGKKVLLTSSTGKAAININGVTLHSAVGVGIINTDSFDEIKKKLNGRYYLKKKWKFYDTLIIDEAPMLDGRTFSMFDKCISYLRNNNNPFGGLQVIVIGDFRQLPPIGNIPVQKNNTKNNLISNNNNWNENKDFIFNTSSWERLKLNIYELETIMRQNDKQYIEILKKIGLGNIDLSIIKYFESLVCKEIPKFDDKIEPVYIFGKNSTVDKINNKKLSELDGEMHILKNKWSLYAFIGSNKYECDTEQSHFKIDDVICPIPLEKYKQIQNKNSKQFGTDGQINVKIGSQIILTYNVNVSKELSNGATGIIEDIKNGKVIVKFKDKKEIIKPLKIYFDVSTVKKNNCEVIFKARLNFYPFKLGWAITSHNSQGMTIDRVITTINNSEIFEYGQAYTILSRVKSPKNLYLLDFDSSCIKANPKVKEYYTKTAKNLRAKQDFMKNVKELRNKIIFN